MVRFTAPSIFKSKAPQDKTTSNDGEPSDSAPSTPAFRKDESSGDAEPDADRTIVGDEKTTNPETTTVTDEKDQVKDHVDESDPDPDADVTYPGPLKLGLLTLGLALATFVVALDNTIIATAIPRITQQFNSPGDVGWYGSAYLLTTTSLQPSFGKIYTYFSLKWVYVAAILIFEVGSILCAAATSSKMLIVGRAVAGCGAAALFSGGMTIVGYSVPLRRRALYIALLSSMFGISSIVGPILGGTLTDKATWRWCFWINLPFGGCAAVAVALFCIDPPRKETHIPIRDKLKQIDLLGASFLICAIVCLLLALQWGGTTYPWSDSRVWGCLLGFGLILSVFIGIQLYMGDRATLPPRIMKKRTIAACALFSALLGLGLYAHIYYLPFYFQGVKGVSAEQSGIDNIPYLVSNILLSIVVGAAITVLGPYNPPMWIGICLFTIGAGLIHTLQVDSPTATWIGYQILAGGGAGACVQIPFIAVQVVLDAKDMPTGNALAIFFNTLGGALSVSIAQNIFSNTLVKEIPKYTPSLSGQQIVQVPATDLRSYIGKMDPALLPGVLEAYNTAVTTAFILPIATGGMAFVASLFMEWKSVKGKKLTMGAA